MADIGRHAARLALLIDAENIPAKFADAIVAGAAKLGELVEARVYGHFDNDKLKAWRADGIAGLGIVHVNIAQANLRKNSADFKLVIEAMDMVHTRHLDGICIASSDGDFSALAERIKATALRLYLFGESKTPADYRRVAHEFFDVATLATAKKAAPVAKPPPAAPPSRARQPKPAPKASAQRGKATGGAVGANQPKAKAVAPSASPQLPGKEPIPSEAVLAAIDKIAKPDGWARAQDVSNLLTADGKFRIKTYAGSVNTLLRATSGVQLEKRGSDTWVRRT